MKVDYIIVQAGGKGTRMEKLTRNKPKALVPVKNRPMLFHLFEKYPHKQFIIIGDYKCEVLIRYLEAFASVSYQVVDATGAHGTCAGLSKALSRLPDGEAFMLIWSDLILPECYKMPEAERNYIGISKDFCCRWSYKQGVFCEEPDSVQGVAGQFIFQNKSQIAQVPQEGEFVRWLAESGLELEELPLYYTKEYGLLAEYQKLETEKCRPFNRLLVEEDLIVKEGIDDQGRALAERECAWYEKLCQKGFPNIPKIYGLHPIRMERIRGKNIYEYTDLSRTQKEQILNQIADCLKQVHSYEQAPADRESYLEAYINKTFQRLSKVRELVPFAKEQTVTVNGRICRNVFAVRKELEEALLQYMPDHFELLHGDCTFSNLLLEDGTRPVLIDPRGYFGTTEFYGDAAYDWAKLYYSLAGNYDQFNRKRFDLIIGESEVELKIQSSHWEDLEPYFFSLLKSQVQPRQIRLIHAVIWLSLTTYAWEDYDSICGAFYNGLYYLEEAL